MKTWTVAHWSSWKVKENFAFGNPKNSGEERTEKEQNSGKHCVQFWQAASLVLRTASLSGKNKKPEGELQTKRLPGTDGAAIDATDTGDGTEVHGPRCIFRCPHMEVWNSPPLDLHGPYPKSARIKEKQDTLWQFHVHLCDRREVTLKEGYFVLHK